MIVSRRFCWVVSLHYLFLLSASLFQLMAILLRKSYVMACVVISISPRVWIVIVNITVSIPGQHFLTVHLTRRAFLL